MKKIALTIPQVAFIAGTRGALGFGAGLLLSGGIPESRRRALGWSLIALGIVTTIPAARSLFGGAASTLRRESRPPIASAGAFSRGRPFESVV